ncbi:MAG: hypothetical protein ACI4WX_03795 [Aristaeellaceae bacterium]
MAINICDHPFLFSTTTKFAYNIDNDFYGGKHYVWAALKFDDLEEQAANSNPLTIANNFIKEVITTDGHCDRINANIVGVRRGAAMMLRSGAIDQQTQKRISNRINDAYYEDFLPLVYVIDTSKVASRIIEVPPAYAALPNSPEYKIMDLQSGEYELIDIARIITDTRKLKRRMVSEYGRR